MASKVKVTLVKSLIGRLEKQVATASSLGLRKIGDVAVQDESPALDGKLFVIKHLIKVEKA